MKGVLGLVEICDEIGDAARVAILAAERDIVRHHPLVGEHDVHAVVEESELLHLFGYHFEVEHRCVEDVFVRKEAHVSTVLIRLFPCFEQRDLHAAAVPRVAFLAAFELGAVHLAVFINFDVQPARKRVGDRSAHTVQTARRLVVLVIELAARVQFCEHHFHAAHAEGGMNVYGYAAAVVQHARAAVRMYGHFYPVAVPVGDLVHRVVDYLPQNVVQSLGARRPDVHARAQPHRVQPFEHLYILSFVILGQLFHLPFHLRGTRKAPPVWYIIARLTKNFNSFYAVIFHVFCALAVCNEKS